MASKRNFVVGVKEPADSRTASGIGLALEFEFHESVSKLGGDTLWLALSPTTTLEQAEELASQLNALGEKLSVS